jgi:hypothetical protein
MIMKKVTCFITILILSIVLPIVAGASLRDEIPPENIGKEVKANDGGTVTPGNGNDTTPKDWSEVWGDTGYKEGSLGNGVMVMINGITVEFPDAQPYIDINNRTMVPIRFIAENLGSNVSWEEKTKTVIIKKGDKTISLAIDSKSYKINSTMLQMDTVPTIKNGRTMVPLRFVGEALGVETNWNGENRTVNIIGGGSN